MPLGQIFYLEFRLHLIINPPNNILIINSPNLFDYKSPKFFGLWLWILWASLVAQLVKNLPAMWETLVQSLGWEDPWRREWLSTPVFWPGEFHGMYSPKESDRTDFHFHNLHTIKCTHLMCSLQWGLLTIKTYVNNT